MGISVLKLTVFYVTVVSWPEQEGIDHFRMVGNNIFIIMSQDIKLHYETADSKSENLFNKSVSILSDF